VTYEQITSALNDFIDHKPIRPLPEESRLAAQYDGLGRLSMRDVLDLTGFARIRDEYRGTHPVHGSYTGQNLSVNLSKNVWHCFRHDTGGGPLAWLAVKHGFIDCGEAVSGSIRGKLFFDILKAEGIEPRSLMSPRQLYLTDTKAAIFSIAELLMEGHALKTLADTKELYVYADGIYWPHGETVVMQAVEQALGDQATNSAYNEVLGHVTRSTLTERDAFHKTSKRYLCVQNGILDLQTRILSPHNPKHCFLNKLPVTYSPHARINTIRTFLSEVVNPEDIPVLQEYLGYILYKDMAFQKSLMLVGEGRNGKSTFINLVKHLVGKENCASVNLQSLEYNRFMVAELFGKLVNVFADIPHQALRQTSMFKILTGGDLVRAEKKFQDAFTFVNYAKFIFSANRLPETPDESDAFFRRWIIINFPNQFEGKRARKGLINELTTEQELSGLLNFALDGLEQLLRNEAFSSERRIDAVREQYIRMSNSVAAFCMDLLRVAPGSHIPKKQLYAAYTEYCRAVKYPIVSENIFHKKLAREMKVEQQRLRVEDERVLVWYGIAWNYSNPDHSSILVRDVRVNFHLRGQNKIVKNEINVREVSETKIEKNRDHPDQRNVTVEEVVRDVRVRNFSTGNEGGADKGRTTPEKPPQSPSGRPLFLDASSVRDTLFTLLADKGMIAIDEFLNTYDARFHCSIEVLLDKLKQGGEIYEPKAGFLKML
jgi:putative DNA primase/helicase